MSNPVQVRIRGEEKVRKRWMEAKGRFDLTHGELAIEMAKYVLENEQEFEKRLQSDERKSDEETR